MSKNPVNMNRVPTRYILNFCLATYLICFLSNAYGQTTVADACGTPPTVLTPSTTLNTTDYTLRHLALNGGATINGQPILRDGFFRFTVPVGNDKLILLTQPASSNTIPTNLFHLEVTTGCSSGTIIYSGSGTSIYTVLSNLTPGDVLYIRVGSNETSSSSQAQRFRITIGTPPANDNCAGATLLTAGATCSNTSGTLNFATSSGLPTQYCGGDPNDDVWYTFTATATSHTVRLNRNSYSTANAAELRFEVYKGSNCSSLSFLTCSALYNGNNENGTIPLNNIQVGDRYYVRIYSATSANMSASFNICVFNNAATVRTNIDAGRGYVNKTRPDGGTIQNGDIIEVRATFSLNGGANILDQVNYVDQIGTGFSYVPNSLKIYTNENENITPFPTTTTNNVDLNFSGNNTSAFSDAIDADAAAFDNNRIKFHLFGYWGTGGTRNSYFHQPQTAADFLTNTKGGLIKGDYRPSFYGGRNIIIASYQLQAIGVNGSVGIIPAASFNFTLDPNSPSTVTTETLPELTIRFTENLGICSQTVGTNNLGPGSESNGTFNTGTTQNRGSSGNVDGSIYSYTPFDSTDSNPQDNGYSVSNNTAKNPTFTGNSAKLFSIWDIVGDRTNTTFPTTGTGPTPTNGGYMLVVNAAFKTGKVFEATISNLCGDTYYEFSAWFRNLCPGCSCDFEGQGAGDLNYNPAYPQSNPTIPVSTIVDRSGIRPNLTFSVDGEDYYTTGDLLYQFPGDATATNYYPGTLATRSAFGGAWVKKAFIFKTGPTQTSFTVSIRNNAPGGGGNDWAMDDIAVASCTPAATFATTPSSYCINNAITINGTVNSFFNNYTWYRWEQSTDGGNTWFNPSGMNSSYEAVNPTTLPNNGGISYSTVTPPQVTVNSSVFGHRYRMVIASNQSNLTQSGCSIIDNTTFLQITDPGCTADPLPSLFLWARGKAQGNTHIITFKTADEEPHSLYTIEKSLDGRLFKAIGTLKANMNPDHEYVFNDLDGRGITSAYRIKRIDTLYNDILYSNIVTIQGVNGASALIAINPFHQFIDASLIRLKGQRLQVRLLGSTGTVVAQEVVTPTTDLHQLRLAVPASLPKGWYILQAASAKQSFSQKIFKE